MSRAFSLVYGLAAYLIFFSTFLYLIGFVGDLFVPLSASHGGAAAPLGTALLINVALIGVFAVQHTIQARPGFKRWLTRTLPAHLERSTFVLTTCAVFALMFTQWRPMDGVVWSIENPTLVAAIYAVFGLGWGIVLIATFVIDHFDLFGLRQTLSYAFGRSYRAPEFKDNLLYRSVRHPLMLGFMVAFWAAPTMTIGRLVFAVTYTVYIVLAIRIEERDLVGEHGQAYEDYRARVPALLPIPRPRAGAGPARASV